MSTPGLWEVFEYFVLCYRNTTNLPWTVSGARQEMKLLAISPKTKFKLQLASIIVATHTLHCFLALFWCLARPSFLEGLSLTQIFGLLSGFFGPACLVAMHFIISFTPEIIPAILSPIPGLQERIAGEKLVAL